MAEHELKKTTKEFMKFGDVEIEKPKFHHSKEVIDVNDTDIKEILVSKEFAYRENKEIDAKSFIGYKTGKTKK